MQEIKPKNDPPYKIGVLVAVIVLVLAALTSSAYFGYRYGFTKAKTETSAKYEKVVGAFMPPLPEEITSFSGTVEKIEDKTLYLKGTKPTTKILEYGQEMTMKVKVVDQTKFYAMKENPEAFKAPAEGELPPEPFIREEKKFEDVKQGSFITATAKENIMGKTEFEALEIQITELTATP